MSSNPPPPSDPDPSKKPEWTLDAFLKTFEASLPGWLSRVRVPSGEIDDAKQEILFEIWEKRETISTNPKEARREVFRIAAKIAQRVKRHAQKGPLYVETLDVLDSRNPEEWISSHVLYYEALNKLEKRDRDLITAHHLEGRTYVELAAEMDLKEDTVRARGATALKKLEQIIDELLRTGKGRKGLSGAYILLDIGADPFSRAVLRALLETEEHFAHVSPPTMSVRTSVASKGTMFSGVPMGLLLGALVLLPSEASPATPMQTAAKISDVPLPKLVLAIEVPVPEVPATTTSARPVESSRKAVVRTAAPVPTLDKATIAALRRFTGQGIHQ